VKFPLSRKDLNRKALKLKMRFFGRYGRWPVSRLQNAEIRNLPMYCISLASAVRRRELVTRQARLLGLTHFHLVEAVDAASLTTGTLQAGDLYDEASAIKYHGRPLTRGEIACSLSHGDLYERIIAAGHPYAVILEDDALFVPTRLDRLNLGDLPADFDVVFLNSFRDQEPPQGRIRHNIYSDASYEGSAAAYLVSRKGAEKLSRACRPVIHAADGLLGRSMKSLSGQQHSFRQQGARTEITSYIIYPDCVLNGSDLRFMGTTLSRSPQSVLSGVSDSGRARRPRG
jgi:glycosyl transferase family 25